MRVIGIDPGLRRTGWGVVDIDGSRVRHVANGVCASEGVELAARLCSLYGQLVEVLRLHRPDTAAVEQTFVNKDAAGTLKLGQARAACVLSATTRGLNVGEYAARLVKKSVVGTGAADKAQVAHMMNILLPGANAKAGDAADALAIAMTHANHMGGFARR